MDILSFHLTTQQIGLFILVAALIGMAKMGVPGLGLAAVPLLALVFGGKSSSGILLVILCFADIFAVIYYHRHADWSHLWRLFPWAALGIVLGAIFGQWIDDQVFKYTMAVIIIVSLVLMIVISGKKEFKFSSGASFAGLLGIMGGFTSMVGNLAGPVMALYLLAMKFPKNQYIGTTAWFFIVVNWFKIPFHVFAWKTITLDTLLLDLFAIPFILLGAYLGVLVVKKIPETTYRWFVIATTAVAAALMLF
ncbi:MAG: sulfite exporter TauE/SafE family protein [Cyclobacteriaceae bacterium]